MKQQKVFITGKIPRIASSLLKQHFDVTMHKDIRLLNKTEIMEGLQDKDALLCLLSDTIDNEVIHSNPQLKIISNYGAGFNNVDVHAATQCGIPVTNTPIVSTNSTADLTMGLIISIARRIVEGDKNTRNGTFHGWSPLYHLGTDLTDKTLGIIGMGNIGQSVARRARGFEMKIAYYDPYRLSKTKEKELGIDYQPFDSVLENADFLSLHLSYVPKLWHLIGMKELAKMKQTAYLINAARGPLVDENALLEALKTKTLAGAALDVYEYEPKVNPDLFQFENVILTPHLGNATIETRDKMAEIAANNIIEVLKGNPPLTCVNPEYIKEPKNEIAK